MPLEVPKRLTIAKRVYRHRGFGLNIHSEIPLPELSPSPGQESPDLIIRKGDLSDLSEHEKEAPLACWNTSEGTVLYCQDLCYLLIRNGKEIIFHLLPRAERRRLRLFLLGSAMSILLHQRGHLVFHGSAVSRNDCGVILLGNKGWGKSTLAAALHDEGFDFISDDVTAIDMKCKPPSILPAFPQLKLWPDALVHFGQDPNQFSKISSRIDKRHKQVLTSSTQVPVPLKKVFLLDGGDSLQIEPIPPREAVIRIMGNLYAARYPDGFLRPDEESCFTSCASLVKQAQVLSIQRPYDLSLLKKTVRLIVDQINISPMESVDA